MSLRADLDKIRQEIERADLDRALDLLNQIPEAGAHRTTISGLRNRFNDWKRRDRQGLLDRSESNAERNRIVFDLLGLLNDIERDHEQEMFADEMPMDTAGEFEPEDTSAPPPPPPAPKPTRSRPRKKSSRPAASEAEAGPATGKVLHSLPNEMTVGQNVMCEVRIAFDEETLRREHRVDDPFVQIRTVKLGAKMRVEIVDPDPGSEAFQITPITNTEQFVARDQSTHWMISVKALRAGDFTLLIRVTALEKRGDDWVPRDTVLHEPVRITGSATTEEVIIPAPLRPPSTGGELAPISTDVLPNIKTILWLSASPDNMDLLGVRREFQRVKEELEDAIDDREIDLQYDPATTTRVLRKSMRRHEPLIVHFSGHGSKEGIFLENSAGRSQLVQTNALSILFKKYASVVNCVVLSACFSEPQATAIAQHIPFVIGSKIALADQEAAGFARTFYEMIANGHDIKESYEEGIMQLELDGQTESAAAIMLFEKNPTA